MVRGVDGLPDLRGIPGGGAAGERRIRAVVAGVKDAGAAMTWRSNRACAADDRPADGPIEDGVEAGRRVPAAIR
jgi:hypothetical protein